MKEENNLKKEMSDEKEFMVTTIGAAVKGEEPAREPETENRFISKEMDNNNAPVEQQGAAATKNGELANEQRSVETPAERSESDLTKSAAHAGDGTTELTDAEKLAFLQDVENLPTLITMMSFLPKFIRKRLVIRISYRAAAKEGIVMVYSNVNRQIDNAQVNRLMASAKEAESKRFENPATVIRLRDILEYQAANVPENERLHFFRFDTGEEVTLDTPAEILDKCVYVDDGQHRVFCCYDEATIDVDLVFEPYNGKDLSKAVRIQNYVNKNWTKGDLEHSNIERGIFKVDFYNDRDDLVKCLGFTAKTAEKYLTFKADRNTKKALVDGKDGISTNPADRERGKDLAYAVRVMSEASEVKKLAMIDAIVDVYGSKSDTERATFRDNMVSMLVGFSEEQVVQVVNFIKESNIGSLKSFIKEEYDTFEKAHKEDLAELVEAANEKIEAKKKELGASAATAKLKQARPEDLLAQRRKDKEEKAAKETAKKAEDEKKKALKMAEKVVKEAKVKVDEMDDAE